MMKIRVIPETNSSSSHALVLPPHTSDVTIFGVEIINYVIEFIEELYNPAAAEEFKKFILSDPEIRKILKEHPEFQIKDVDFDIDSYTIPYIINDSPADEKQEIFKLYKKVLIEAIKNNWGVELQFEERPTQPNVPWYSPIFSDGTIKIYRPGNYTLYILTARYNTKNIHTKVKILDDGETDFTPRIPESIDLKITNKCYAMCPFCHENSTPDGEHADDETLKKFYKTLEETPIPEIAVGGGNPLLHPDIEKILFKLAQRSNPAITARDIDYIEYGIPRFVVGYGISLTTPANLAKLFNISDFNAHPVIHVINGVHKTEDVAKAIRIYIERGPSAYVPAVLILGFKHYGRGRNWKIRNTIDIDALMKKHPNVVYAFDDLAVRQLNLKDKIPRKEWELFYNGEDEKYTMYIDLVKKQYAKNSYSEERHSIKEWNIEKMFAVLKGAR